MRMHETMKAIYCLAFNQYHKQPLSWYVVTWFASYIPDHIRFLQKYLVKDK